MAVVGSQEEGLDIHWGLGQRSAEKSSQTTQAPSLADLTGRGQLRASQGPCGARGGWCVRGRGALTSTW